MSAETGDQKGFAGLEPGAMVDHYRIIRPLGAGGMAEVYPTRDGRLRVFDFGLSQLFQDSDAVNWESSDADLLKVYEKALDEVNTWLQKHGAEKLARKVPE